MSPSNVVTVLNILAVWDEGLPAFCLCLFVVCANFQKDRRRRVLLLKEFDAENFEFFKRVDFVLSTRVEGVVETF